MDDRLKKHLPIDRGWAWVISLASCLLFGLPSGSFKCWGIIQVEMEELFPHTSVTEILWILRMPLIINKLSGPLNGYLLTKVSHRTLSIIGAIAMSSSLIIFGYLPSTGYMYPVLGLGYGLGSGATHLVAFTAYTNYFEKKKALAVGIASSGSGVTTICVPFFLRYLFDNGTFSSAMLLYGGLTLHLLVMAFLLRPISYYEERAKWKLAAAEREGGDEGVVTPAATDKFLEENLCSGDQVSPDVIQRRHSISASKLTAKSKLLQSHSFTRSTPSLSKTEEKQDKRDVMSLLFRSTTDITGSAIFYELQNQTADEDRDKVGKTKKVDWRLALSPASLCIGLATVCYVSGVGPIYQCAPPLGQATGVSKQTVARALMIAGVVEIPCRIFNGFLADRKIMSAVTQMSLYMCLTGLASLLCGLISGLPGILIILVVMSSVGTSFFNLMPIVCGELLGQENVTTGMGINFVYQSIATVIGVFSTGMLYDSTERWENVYFFVSGGMILGGVITGALALYHFIKARRLQTDIIQE